MKQRTYVRHGLYKHPLYATWQNMKRRCYDTNNTKYHRYGGRGIKVCDAWLKWRAYICINRQVKSLGHYVSKADAIAARRQAESELVYG